MLHERGMDILDMHFFRVGRDAGQPRESGEEGDGGGAWRAVLSYNI